jgi:hypothetical protein
MGVVSTTLRLLYSQGNNPQWTGHYVGSRVGLEAVEKTILPYPESNPDSSVILLLHRIPTYTFIYLPLACSLLC